VIENARQFGVNVYQKAEQTVTLEVLRGGQKKTLKVAIRERPRDPDRILSLVKGDENLVPRLGILAVDLDEKVTPLLPSLRRLSGAVVAGAIEGNSAAAGSLLMGDVIYEINNHPVNSLKDLSNLAGALKPRQPVVLHIERLGQLQFVLLDVD
jgi:S1-C subfamily serine protease